MPATARRCLLIGGRSNTGKSTVANVLAQRLAGVHISTDTLGRHPGRPWGTVPTQVVEHYRAKSDDDIFAAVVAHQRDLQPAIAALVREHETNSDKPILVLEGSALMPEETLGLISKTVAAVWLTGSDAFLRKRIESESHYGSLDIAGRYLVDQFIERNRRLDQMNRDDAQRLGLPTVIVDGLSIDEVAAACLRAVADPPLPLR